MNDPLDPRPRPSGGDPADTAPSVAEVLESVSDAFYALDRYWRFSYLNGAAEHLLRRGRGELLGKNVWEEFPPAVGTAFYREYHRAVADGVTAEFEEFYPPLDGWFNVRAFPAPSGGLAVYFQNVTDRRSREEELRRANERFVLAARAVAGLIYDVDLALGSVQRSEGLLALVGYRPEEAEPTADWWVRRIHPEDRAECLATAEVALADPSRSQYEGEYRVLHRDGRHVLVWDRALILRDGWGRAVRLVGSTFDVTARRQAEQALRESEARFHAFMDNGPVVTWVKDERFRYVYGNRAWEQRHGRLADCLGLTDLDLWPRIAARLRATDEAVLSSGRGAEFTTGFTGRDGVARHHHVYKFPFTDARGRRFVGGMAIDVTDRLAADEELRDSRERLQALSRQLLAAQECERRRLARELHDELGQTLTAASINLKAALAASAGAGAASPPGLAEAAAIVDQAIEQVRSLSLDLRPSVLDDLGLEAALRWYADRLIRRAGLAVHLNADLGPGRLPGEVETACFRVAQEALTNVARHSGARSAWVELRLRGGAVELIVRDDGAGFDSEAARRRAAGGASSGLLGMQERVELLGGELAVESRPGRGATVRARVPASGGQQGQSREGGDDDADPSPARR